MKNFQVGERVKFLKPLSIGYTRNSKDELVKDIREGLIGWVMEHHANPSDSIAHLVPVSFGPLINNLYYLDPKDLEHAAS